MSSILIFTGTWDKWYRVLRYGHRFGLLDSVRYGLWLARGEREALAITRIHTAKGQSDLRPHSNPIFPSWGAKRQSDGKYETPCRP